MEEEVNEQAPKEPTANSDVSEEEDSGDENDTGSKKKSGPVNGLDPDTRGDEDEIMSEQILGDETEEKIPDDFYYNYDDYISKPVISDESGLPQNILTLSHSFGYDCMKRANLHILDKDVVVFAAGNYVQIINLKSKEHKYIRSTSGGGIGAITVHPSKSYLAIAEKGSMPNINIYEYPSLKLYRIQRLGTERAYSFIDFSPDGKLLASVGSDPDFMLTLWDWKQEKIVLRSKAFSQDVFRVTFSMELEGQLTSSGIGHVRFWKMARTFTGLKLQGQLGKFGKKEISDIEGYVELPDGKVLSGCEWGNMLLWDGGLIKVELCRKNKKSCHQGAIQQIIMDEGELMTIGLDGYIRVWDFETVDNADTTNEVEMFEMEPMNELKVGSDVQLRCMVKSCEPETTFWYAQDASGGIWKLDLSFSFTSALPEKLFSFHSGPILGIGLSPVTNLVTTIGVDYTIRVYDYLAKELLCMSKFNMAGTSVMWVPKIVDPKGSTIVSGYEDGVLRILSLQKMEGTDQHGRKLTDKSELILKQACKPHKNRIVSMDFDSKGEILATGSNDCTVFFMSVGETYEPIGFIKTPSHVTHLQWSPASFKRNTLLVCCYEGHVLEVEAPDPTKIDTVHSYQLEGLKIRTHKFKTVKSVILHEQELAMLAKEEEERKKREREEILLRIENGDEVDASELDQEVKEEEKKVEEPWEPYIPEKPSTVLYGFHSKEEGKFWLSMGEYDSGYLYECEFLEKEEKKKRSKEMMYEPLRVIPIHDANDISIHCIGFSSSGKHLYFGMANGAIRIQPLHNDDPGLMGSFWSLNVHDNNYGQITRVCSSYDDRYLFSVGMDGNFFMFDMMNEKKIEAERIAAEIRAKIPSAKKEVSELRIEDIADPKAYSIEDARQKSEYDKMLQLAEEKKSEVRQQIQSLRDEFKNLKDLNNSLPEGLRINDKEFEMDPEIKKELEHQKELKINNVKKEMAWEEAKHQLALDKIHKRFKEPVDCEFITIKAFREAYEVSSFRVAKLSKGYYIMKDELEQRRIAQALSSEAARQATLAQAENQDGGVQETGKDLDSSEVKLVTTVRGSMGERIIKALAKVEEKKKKRAARQAQWDELFGSKPDSNNEDPLELAAIKDAQEHMGDYKLKSADDYVVPDHLRMNAEKARGKLVLLKEGLHHRKKAFNARLMALRDKKLNCINEITNLVTRLENVQNLLGQSIQIPEIPALDRCECPEKNYEYTNEILLKFKAELAERERALTGPPGPVPGIISMQPITTAASSSTAQNSMTAVNKPLGREQSSLSEVSSSQEPQQELNEHETKMKMVENVELLYQRDSILAQIDDIVKNFDAELRCLRHEKFSLDIELKNADLRHMTLYEELVLLKDFEKRENVLASKLDERLEEKMDMQNKISDVLSKIELKKKDIEKLQEKEKVQMAAFVESIADNKFAEYLTKVYKKKIKRSKKNTSEGADDDSDDESDDESDYSESEEESESETGGLDLDVCPMGCDQTIYDNTCMLREKRLDVEEALAEEKKNRDMLNKELESMQKRAKVIETSAKAAETDLEAFQLEKQQKLNELDIVVTLQLHQIEHVVNGSLPSDLSKCLVFDAPGLSSLKHRIKELEQERIMQKKQQIDAKRKHVQLIKDRRTFDQRINAMRDDCNKLMMNKFGRLVDIEVLETITVNRQIEEVKERLMMTETQNANDLQRWNERIRAAKDEMTALIRKNTEHLDQLTLLYSEQKTYETDLDSRQNNLGSAYGGVQKSEVDERQRLIQLVHLQAKEIEALKDEILMLSRKSGHILPPAQIQSAKSQTS